MIATSLILASTIVTTAQAAPSRDCRQFPTPPTNGAAPNDNRLRAGTLRDGVLTLRLVAHQVAWRPDGPDGCSLSVHAFPEEGRPTQIPGPLIRVTAGTEVRVTVRNALAKTLWLRGLQDRLRRDLDSIEVPIGATREVSFVANAVGAWFYWAGDVEARVPASTADGQLVGALVVDAPNDTSRATTQDRVLLLTRWNPTGTAANTGFQVNAFNGRSWPNTERVAHTVGDSVFWKVINASNATHEMHLHGFFFRLDRGGFAIDSGTPRLGLGGMRVTAVLRRWEWIVVAWSPERPGNWLFHCHLLTHMSGAQKLSRLSDSVGTAPIHHVSGPSGNHAMDDMAGLVLGVEVRPRGAVATREASSEPARRVLDLFANERPRRFGDRSGYGFVLQEGAHPPAKDSIRIPGTPLILRRGEPVRIAVHNRLTFPISVHWHGIELESYFDGVGGYSGAGNRIAPMIAPNDSFVVHMTPPRAGTNIYHVHGESGEELASGLYGPLIVLDSSITLDPQTDRVFLLSDGGPGAAPPIFINGSATPDTVELIAGRSYRFRLIYIAADDIFFTTLSTPGTW